MYRQSCLLPRSHYRAQAYSFRVPFPSCTPSDMSAMTAGSNSQLMKPNRTSFDDEFDEGPMEWEEYDVELPPSEAEVRAATAPCSPAPTVLGSSPSPSTARSEGTAPTSPSVQLPLQDLSPSTEQSSASSPPAPPPAAVNPIDGPASQQSRKRIRRKAPPVGYYKAMKERRFKRARRGIFFWLGKRLTSIRVADT